ncbi:NAD(P)/FAD-dependent oxidoreductase, partial [Modestobacter caceresii]|uniref:NAD(P)/FAD-dependent oxidoreductase n=1 Tax=Modestobacter caceresii TaxID=1522368 RepID=UPI0005680063
MGRRVVVIGGDAAGGSAASQATKRQPDLDVVMFERGRATSYSACGIPYWIGGTVGSEVELIARTPDQHRAAGVDVRMRTEVTGIDLDRRVVLWRELEGGGEGIEPFDELVYAAGSVPMRPPIPGIDAAGVYGVQVLDDGVALRAELDSGRVRTVVVVGGGYIGLEIAEACQVRGLQVTVVDRSATPVGTFDPDIGEFIADAVRGVGIDLLLSEAVVAIDVGPDGRARAVMTASGGELPADLVVLGLGVRPNIRLAQEAGIPLGTSGGIAVDARMRTQVEGVWAAGDCVESRHRLSGQRMVVALGTHANKQGRVAGINIGGGYATFPGVIGTAITKVCDLEVARTGLSSEEALAAGYSFVTASVDSTTKAGYFPGSR